MTIRKCQPNAVVFYLELSQIKSVHMRLARAKQ